MNRTSMLIKETPESCHASSTGEKMTRNGHLQTSKQALSRYGQNLLRFPSLQNCEK
jgi:hypothetical protein